MFHTLLLLADDAPKTAPPGPAGFEMILFMVVPLVLMYFLVLRPGQKRQEQERAALLANTKKNDRVLTTAGIYGVVVAVSDTEDEVTVRVDDNTRLKMLKSAIARNLTNEEAAKAAKEGKKEGAA
jgi:preprotein translocase subunit YajC